MDARRCVETARRRCVFKIYNVTRLKIFAPQTSGGRERIQITDSIFTASWGQHTQSSLIVTPGGTPQGEPTRALQVTH